MTDKTKAAMRQAIEALERCDRFIGPSIIGAQINHTLAALREAEQAEPPKVEAQPLNAEMTFDASTAQADILRVENKGKLVVCITADGKAIFGAGYTPDDAAREFWEAMGRHALIDDTALLRQCMEALCEFTDSHTSQYPPAEMGQAAQTAWVVRKTQAVEQSRAAIATLKERLES